MEQETKQVMDKALDLVREVRLTRDVPKSPDQMFEEAQELMALSAFLAPKEIQAESEYNEVVATFVENESKAKAEVLAKRSEEYKNWRLLKRVSELIIEEIHLIKKFSDRLNREPGFTTPPDVLH